MTRFDASAWAGIWPFTMSAPVSLAAVVTRLEATGVTGAAISPLNAVLAPEPMGANLALLAEFDRANTAAFDVRVVPVINPSLPGWEDDFASLVRDHGAALGAVKLVPNYHGYAVDGRETIALARAAGAAGLGVCVQARMLDERAHHPLMKVPGVAADGIARLAAAVPEARFLACGLYQAELAHIAPAGNVSAELSSVESGDALANALAVLGEDRLLLGTHAPVYDPAPGVAKAAAGDPDTRIRVASFNAAAFFA